MSEPVIKVEGLYKKFTNSIRRSLAYGTIDVTRNFFNIPSKQDTLRKGEFWALQDVNFELRQGETLGIIGVNGSGKSTLLRLISGIFPPDKGRITVKGKVGSLIAVGAGFHPHMSGKENIYLNGTILGMTKKEIDKKYDEIVDFAEIGDFLNAPVSTYSSGMRVRLGFSIAVHTEPEILLVDEVLSVGDINFQRKSTTKLQEVKQKTATIFVSHSIRHVNRICDQVMLLNKGIVEKLGDTSEIINQYVNESIVEQGQEGSEKIYLKSPGIEKVTVKSLDRTGKDVNEIVQGTPFDVEVNIDASEEFKNVLVSLSFTTLDGAVATFINTEDLSLDLKSGENKLVCKLKRPRLLPGKYFIKVKVQYKLGGLIYEADTDNVSIIYEGSTFRPYLGYYFEETEWQKE